MTLIEIKQPNLGADSDLDLAVQVVFYSTKEGVDGLVLFFSLKDEFDLPKGINFMDGLIANTYKLWNRAGAFNIGMRFDCGLAFAEECFCKHRKAPLDSRFIDCIDYLFEREPIGVIRMQSAGFTDKDLSENSINTPVAKGDRISELSPCDAVSDAHCNVLLHWLEYFESHQTQYDNSVIKTDPITFGWNSIHVTEGPYTYMDQWWLPDLLIVYEHSFVHQVAGFIEGIDSCETNQPDFANRLETPKICEAVFESGQSGKWFYCA